VRDLVSSNTVPEKRFKIESSLLEGPSVTLGLPG
jgi:hypothetical protein